MTGGVDYPSITDELMKLKCQRCKHEWNYRGKNLWVTSCPRCHTSVSVRKAMIPPVNTDQEAKQ
jgi:hypothetical protein